MKKLLKWLGIILGGLVVLVGLAAVVLHFVGRSQLNNAPEVTTKSVTVPTDTAAIAHGDHLVNTVSTCTMCHGQQLEGEVFIDGELGSYVTAPNLTSGQGGIGGSYSDADWERAIRHGIGRDNRALTIMPSNFYQHYSDEDLGAMIAYLKSVPAVDNDLGQRQVGFPGTIIFGVMAFDDVTRINGIDHATVGQQSAPAGVTVEYGEYLATIAACSECHAANLAGIVGDDGPPPGPNLTPGGELGSWTEADFIQTIRTGQTPSGEQLNGEEMPWPSLSQMTDTELQAIWTYLQSLPALADNN
ncbi:MAG: c-type cytochrome [Anaerolineales bacterium]|nr:c-type cytochrome [Anaerolineales bacterium]